MEGEAHAGLPGTARELTGYGLRILIDGATNSLPSSETLTTLRQRVLDLEPMDTGHSALHPRAFDAAQGEPR